MNRLRTLSILAMSVSFSLALLNYSNASITEWSASSGLLPEEAGYRLINNSTPEDPSLSGSDLTLSTSTSSENMYYLMDESKLDVPDVSEISFRVKIDSGTVTDTWPPLERSRGPAMVGITTSANVGVNFWIGLDEILTNAEPDGRGPANTTIDTDDAFHDYFIRIEGTAAGGAVSIFQDSTLVLSTTLNTSSGLYGPTQRVIFGEATSLGYGTSRWQNFSHNLSLASSPLSSTVSFTSPKSGSITVESKVGFTYRLRRSETLSDESSIVEEQAGTGAPLNFNFDDSATSAPKAFFWLEESPAS